MFLQSEGHQKGGGPHTPVCSYYFVTDSMRHASDRYKEEEAFTDLVIRHLVRRVEAHILCIMEK